MSEKSPYQRLLKRYDELDPDEKLSADLMWYLNGLAEEGYDVNTLTIPIIVVVDRNNTPCLIEKMDVESVAFLHIGLVIGRASVEQILQLTEIDRVENIRREVN